jgi:hypothetical protein
MAKKGKLITQQRLANMVQPLILRDVLRNYYNESGGNMEMAAISFSKSYGVQMSAMSYRRHMEQVGLEIKKQAVIVPEDHAPKKKE